jgi:uncharacterized protein (TIGR03034 family)
LAILLSCVGWTPAQAQGTAPEEETIDNVTQTLDNEDSPEYVDAEQFEEAGHVQRLYDEEELDTYVYLNEDGSKSVYYMDQDVKFIDEQGNVQEKDTALVRKERGYGMRSNDVGLHIPDSAADGITVSHKSREVKLLPVGGTGLAAANNNSILYSNFFGRGIHLQYTPMLSGVKEDVIITKYTGVNSFSFLLETGGLYLLDADGRYYLAESPTAKAAFYLGEVLVYDAIGRPDLGTMTVETITAGQRYKLTVSANEAFLTDPETLYPVTIDPTLTVSDNTHGAGAVEDAPVFSGKPNKNFGSYVYNTIGYHSADYGTAMTVVRLAGLLSDDIYESLSESNIENVTFYMKDGGSSSAAVNIHAVTGSDTWTESNVTSSNLGAYSMAIYATDTMGGGSWGEFNITYLVRLWKNGTLNPQRGFVMAISDSTKKIGTLSSEYSNTDYRPYVVVTYTLPPGIEIAVDEGDVIQLNTNMTGEITWTSSDESLATVSSYGLVEGIRAGKVTITASCSNHEFSTYTVYVTVPDGVYYVKNLNSNYYLHVNAGGINNLTDVIQYSKYSDTTTATYRIRQMWKTCYLGNGRYSIRPMNKLDKGLDVTSGNVDIHNIGTSDTLSSVPSYGEWTIEWYTTGYVFKNNGDSSKTMQVQDASTAISKTIIASTYSASVNCRWELTRISAPPSGAYLYDTSSKEIVTTTTKSVDVGTSKSLTTLQLCAVAFSGTDKSQTFTWSSSNPSVATVDSSGSVTGVSAGITTISGCVYRNGSYHYVSYTLNVSKLLIYQTVNTYYYDADGNYAKDLICGDMSTDELRALDWVSWADFVGYTPAHHRADWELMCTTLFSTGELQTVILDMIDHFMDGSGTSYSNSVLTQKAYEHDSTQNYIENVKRAIETLLNAYDGDIGALAYTTSTRDSNPLVMALKADNIYQPVYNTDSDIINGLTICVDGLWGNKIEVSSYSISGNSYSYTLHYTLYDHFGLDQPDVEKYGPLTGFRSWYVLQHYSEYDSAYMPFLTIIEFDVIVSGTIS